MPTERVSSIDSINDVEQLEDLLSAPTPRVVESMRRLKGDVLILGVGGKMGPSLARMIKRASTEANVQRRVIGVSRFSSGGIERQLRQWGISTLAADLLDRNHRVAHAERAGQPPRDRLRGLRVVLRRQVEGRHTIGSEGLDGDRQGQRRVDAP